MVGRTVDVRALERHLDQRELPTSVVLAVTGDAGIGKTALLRGFAAGLRNGRHRVVERSAHLEGPAPRLWTWTEIASHLDKPVTLPDTVSDQECFVLIRDAVEAAAGEQPLVVVLDDMDEADPSTVGFLHHLARSPLSAPLVVVTGWRAAPATNAGTGVVRHELRPLDDDAATELLTAYPALSDEERSSCRALAAGNPFLLHHLAGAIAIGESATPPEVTDFVRGWLEALDPEISQAFLAAAVLGEDAKVADVARLAKLPSTTITDIGRRSGGLAAARSGQVAFRHGITPRVILEQTPAAVLAEQHHSAVAALQPPASTADACRIARHAAAAAVASEERASVAIELCRSAARAARQAGWLRTSAELLEMAKASGAAHPALRELPTLHVEHAWAVLATGRLVEASARFEAAWEVANRAADPTAAAEAAIGLGGLWVEEARDVASRDRLMRLLEAARDGLPDDEAVLRARVDVRIAAENRYQGLTDVPDVAAAVDRLRSLGDDGALVEGLSLLHHVMLTPPYAHERVAVAEELLAAARRTADPFHSLLGSCWLTVDYFLLGDRRADRTLEDFRTQADALDCTSMRYIVAVMDAMRAIRDGQLDEAESLAEAASALGAEAGDADAFAYFGGQLLAIRWLQGRVPEIREVAEDLAQTPTTRIQDVVFLATAAASAALDGDVPAAQRWLRGTDVGSAATLPLFSTWTTAMLALTETAVTLDDPDLADDLVPLLEPFADLPVRPSLAVACLGPMRRLVGLLHVVAGRHDRGVDVLHQALDDCRALRNRPVEAVLDAELAWALSTRGRTGDTAEAALLLERAIAAATELDLTGRIPTWTEQLESLRTTAAPATRTAGAAATGLMERHQEQWRFALDGREAWTRDSVGLRHLSVLLRSPGVEHSALELSERENGVQEVWTGEPVLDQAARRAYGERLAELDAEIERARAEADLGWVDQLVAERDVLAEHVANATNLTGRDRRASDARERARMRVSKAIRRALSQVSESDPLLGAELNRTVQTGHHCRYEPDPVHPREWRVVT